jgi:hypothetical protein
MLNLVSSQREQCDGEVTTLEEALATSSVQMRQLSNKLDVCEQESLALTQQLNSKAVYFKQVCALNNN